MRVLSLSWSRSKKHNVPTSEWIANSYEQYFGYLIKFGDVETVIGTLPGTTKTAIELKEIMNCRLVFLATNKIEELGNEDELKREMGRIANNAHEVWCLWLDVYAYYQDIFQDLESSSNIRYHNIMLQPSTRQASASKPQAQETKFLSVWNRPNSLDCIGRRVYSKGSCLQNFCTLSVALEKINSCDPHRSNVDWNIHGLRFQDKKSIEKHATFTQHSLAWVPTIVSETSATGKFLQQIPCAEKALVSLSGDAAKDPEIWEQKIYKDILHEDAKAMLWAKEISEYQGVENFTLVARLGEKCHISCSSL